jgi:hypothetical protein
LKSVGVKHFRNWLHKRKTFGALNQTFPFWGAGAGGGGGARALDRNYQSHFQKQEIKTLSPLDFWLFNKMSSNLFAFDDISSKRKNCNCRWWS